MTIGAEPSSAGILIRVSEGAGTLSGMQYVRDAARQNAFFNMHVSCFLGCSFFMTSHCVWSCGLTLA